MWLYLATFLVGMLAHWVAQEWYYRWKGFEGNVVLFPETVIAMRDAFVEEDAHEAYHQLYQAVAESGDSKYDPYDPWVHIEKALEERNE